MSLLKQRCTYDNVVLEFYSFIDPLTYKLWLSGVDIATGLRFKEPRQTINYIAMNGSDTITTWSNLISSKSTTPHLYPTLRPESPYNWDPDTLMVNENIIEMLVMVSSLECAPDLKSWLKKTVFADIRKNGPYGFNNGHSGCMQCQIELNERLYTLQRRIKSSKAQLAECQRKINYIERQMTQPPTTPPPSQNLQPFKNVQETFV